MGDMVHAAPRPASPSSPTRSWSAALSWFTDGIRIFSPDAVPAALAHLDLSQDQCDATKTRLREMAATVPVPVR